MLQNKIDAVEDNAETSTIKIKLQISFVSKLHEFTWYITRWETELFSETRFKIIQKGESTDFHLCSIE